MVFCHVGKAQMLPRSEIMVIFVIGRKMLVWVIKVNKNVSIGFKIWSGILYRKNIN